MLTALVFAAAIALSPASPPVGADSVRREDITRAYADLIDVKVDLTPIRPDSVLYVAVVTAPAGSLLSSISREQEQWLTYLILHGRGFTLPDVETGSSMSRFLEYKRHEPLSVLRQRFARLLAEDSTFNVVAIPVIAAWLRREGRAVATSLLATTRPAIAMDTVMQVAVRFFYPDLIIDGNIATHVCTVINAVRQLPNRNLALEAMVFSAINRDILLQKASRLEADFGPARRLMNGLLPGGPDAERLTRAQGVMWGLMSQSQRLREILRAESVRSGDVLPFVLAEQ